eukprot:6461883-Pyramimonas_sp.AAC.4
MSNSVFQIWCTAGPSLLWADACANKSANAPAQIKLGHTQLAFAFVCGWRSPRLRPGRRLPAVPPRGLLRNQLVRVALAGLPDGGGRRQHRPHLRSGRRPDTTNIYQAPESTTKKALDFSSTVDSRRLSTLVYRSAHGISNTPLNNGRIFPADRLSLAGRQSTPELDIYGVRNESILRRGSGGGPEGV